jgi:hypothetical protein
MAAIINNLFWVIVGSLFFPNIWDFTHEFLNYLEPRSWSFIGATSIWYDYTNIWITCFCNTKSGKNSKYIYIYFRIGLASLFPREPIHKLIPQQWVSVHKACSFIVLLRLYAKFCTKDFGIIGCLNFTKFQQLKRRKLWNLDRWILHPKLSGTW